jgi:serine/threonine-protein kinase
MTTTPAPVYGGRYELRNQIARGGTAQVYLARDLLLDRPVALKVLFPELSTDHSFVERFRREAQAAANLMHPNIVQVFDWGESERTYFIVMEYIDGEPLSSIIRTQSPLAGPQAASIASDIAKALSYAHRHGVVHRDVKPGNVLITADGQVKVTDFGIARAIGTDEQVTQTGLVMGTATYFSPEQAQGLAVDARSDVYALGVVLYEMLTGRPPFSGETPVAIAYQHVREQPPTPRSLNPTIPAALEAIVLQAMAKLPAERYVSADEMKADLDRFVHGQTVLASPPRTGGSTGPVTTVLAATGGDGRRGADTAIVEAVDDDRGERGPKSTTPWWLAGGLLLLVAIGIVVWFGGRSLGYFGGKGSVAVPSVVNEPATTAESQIRSAGLVPAVTTDQPTGTNIANSGKVRSQSPAPPTHLASGGTVHLVVWGNPASKNVPNVYGQPISNALTSIKGDGFKVIVRYFVATSASQKQGSVYRQNPKGGTSLTQGSSITVYVAQGTKNITVPSVAGDSPVTATSVLTKAGFNVSSATPTTQLSSTVPNGDIISTNPPAYSQEAPGTTISLVESRGSVNVPSVVGETAAQAEQAMTSAGLTFRVANQPNAAPDQVGFVTATSPVSGTPVATGRQIVIFVGSSSTSSSTTTSTTTTTTPGGNSGTTPTTTSTPAGNSGSANG